MAFLFCSMIDYDSISLYPNNDRANTSVQTGVSVGW